MIKVKTVNGEIILNPTIFPDGTSQVWKLTEEFLNCREYNITWNFESEREIIDLYSFKALLSQPETLRFVALNIPYLPYARQDKMVDNQSTFNLEVFATLINGLGFSEVTAVDVHNPKRTAELINNFRNIKGVGAREQAIFAFAPDYIVFPDSGASIRYSTELSHIKYIVCDKVREQSTGKITGIKAQDPGLYIERYDKLLIVDDICDGGATFIGVADHLRSLQPEIRIGLFVTHGIFSKGRQHLLNNGIDEIYTTDSLLKNTDGYKV